MRVLEYIKDRNNLDFLKNQWEEVLKRWNGKTVEEIEEARIKQNNKEFAILVNRAKQEWKDAQNYFEHVTDPDLIDLAIYRIQATMTFYMYLLKEAKRKGVKVEKIS